MEPTVQNTWEDDTVILIASAVAALVLMVLMAAGWVL